MCARVGYKKPVVPALEAFGGTMSKQAATLEAFEGIKATGLSLLNAIIAAIKKVIDFFAELWKKFVNSLGNLLKKYEHVNKYINAASEWVNGEVDMGAKAKYICPGNTTSSTGDEIYEAIGFNIESVYRTLSFVKDMSKPLENILASNRLTDFSADDRGVSLTDWLDDEVSGYFSKFKTDLIKTVAVYSNGEQVSKRVKHSKNESGQDVIVVEYAFNLGGKSLYIDIPDTKETKMEHEKYIELFTNNFSCKIDVSSWNVSEDDIGTKVKTITKKQAKDLLSELSSKATAMSKLTSWHNIVLKNADKIITIISGNIKSREKELSELKNITILNDSLKVIKSLVNTNGKMISLYMSEEQKIMDAILEYVYKCAKTTQPTE